jgi:hypothetical protein
MENQKVSLSEFDIAKVTTKNTNAFNKVMSGDFAKRIKTEQKDKNGKVIHSEVITDNYNIVLVTSEKELSPILAVEQKLNPAVAFLNRKSLYNYVKKNI